MILKELLDILINAWINVVIDKHFEEVVSTKTRALVSETKKKKKRPMDRIAYDVAYDVAYDRGCHWPYHFSEINRN